MVTKKKNDLLERKNLERKNDLQISVKIFFFLHSYVFCFYNNFLLCVLYNL